MLQRNIDQTVVGIQDLKVKLGLETHKRENFE